MASGLFVKTQESLGLKFSGHIDTMPMNIHAERSALIFCGVTLEHNAD